jgi:hypothetical protein
MIHQQEQAGNQAKKKKTYISETSFKAKHFINRKIFTISAKAP